MDFTALLVLLAGMASGYALGWMRGKQLLAGAISRAQYDGLMQEKTTLETKLEAANAERGKLTEFHERALISEADKRALEQRLKEQQEQMRLEFKNTAATIFEDISKKFSTQSEKKIGDLLDPLKIRIIDFQQQVDKHFKDHGNEQFSLKAEIEKFIKTSDAMRLETGNLAKALRGDVKAQGNWGEVILERILEAAGLRKGIEYIAQGSDMDLADDDGNRQKPDYIVKLPEDKHIIIDSKVSLASYDRYCNEQEEELKSAHLKDFLKSVRSHITGLSEKRYHDLKKLNAPDFVFLFMPIEGAYSLAMQHDPELQDYTWNKKITLVCPGTLHPSMRIVSLLWSIERQNKHTEEIARQGGALYDKFHGFITDLQKIGGKVHELHEVYDGAMNKLSTGKGNLINRVENLHKLGVKIAKPLPRELLNEDDVEIAALPLPALVEGA